MKKFIKSERFLGLMADISEIFTKKNLQIITLLGKGGLHLRDIALQVKCSPAKVHDSIKLFHRYDLIRIKTQKNRKIITLNRNSALLADIQSIMVSGEAKPLRQKEERLPLYQALSPLDFRYYGRDPNVLSALAPYLSEEGFVRYMCKVEAALAATLSRKKICPKAIADEIVAASKQVTAQEVYAEEDRIKHNVRALANAIRNKVSDKAKPYVHFTATSHDIICTADAARYKEFTNDVLLPALVAFEKTLIDLALSEKDTVQIGRTHGQHAEPITFGFAIAQYISRLGCRIVAIKDAGNSLRGKMAGAVGAYNASSLVFRNPALFEKEVLEMLSLMPSPISTQIVGAEYMADYVHACVSCFGVLANLADDMRHLQRSEIGEVGELFDAQQVGSSTMPQKRNPINFENVKSMWKAFMPRMTTVYLDQISEHQRDLTNSASSRFIPELLAALYLSIERMQRTMSKLQVDKAGLERNFSQSKGMIIAEPAYILLALHKHPDAHEAIRTLTIESKSSGKSVFSLMKADKELKHYVAKFTLSQIALLQDLAKYTGIAARKTEDVCNFWKKALRIR